MLDANGFINGVRLASDNRRDDRQAEQQKVINQMSRDLHSRRMGLADINQQMAEQNLAKLQYQNSDEVRAQQAQRNARADELQQLQINSLRGEQAHLANQRNKAELQERLQQGLQALSLKEQAGQQVTLDDFKAFDGTVLDVNRYMDANHLADLQLLDKYLNPSETNYPPNNPELLALMNRVFPNEIGAGEGVNPETGANAVAKQIEAVRNVGNGKYVPSLKIDYEDGTSRRDVPMTVGRDHLGDEVMQVSLTDLIDQVQVRKRYGEMLQPLLNVARGYGKQPKANNPKGSFDALGQKGLDMETFQQLYEQNFMATDPLTGGAQPTVSFQDVMNAGNDSNALSALRELDQINRVVISDNALVDQDEQKPLLSYRQYMQMKSADEQGNSGAGLGDLLAAVNQKEKQQTAKQQELINEAYDITTSSTDKIVDGGKAVLDAILPEPEQLTNKQIGNALSGSLGLGLPKKRFVMTPELQAIADLRAKIAGGERSEENFKQLAKLIEASKASN
ncbi:hypothetical protein J7384_17760 [Endozoicomonas sp. G2_1]|uniref:hypothetical protein n=1 Tax=Endozoicomonas sp. G2_1 TaxID=2821091 RepID=UPI001AD978C2|nr:hypothetical protein [Endozoicomonas sp. G2_1]MBO9492212.1 hypothetical protein [Endozoicomonas sp. G2_1]